MADQSLFKIIPQLGHGTFTVTAAVILDRDEEYLVASLDENATLVLWDILSGQQVFELNFGSLGGRSSDLPSQLLLTGEELFAYGGSAVFRWPRKLIPSVKTAAEGEIRRQIERIAGPATDTVISARLSAWNQQYAVLAATRDADQRISYRLALYRIEEGRLHLRSEAAILDPVDDFVCYDDILILLQRQPGLVQRLQFDPEHSTWEAWGPPLELAAAANSWLSEEQEQAFWVQGTRLAESTFLTRAGFDIASDSIDLGQGIDDPAALRITDFRVAEVSDEHPDWKGGSVVIVAVTLQTATHNSIRIFQSGGHLRHEIQLAEPGHRILAFSQRLRYLLTAPPGAGPLSLWNIEREPGALERRFVADRPEIVSLDRQGNDAINIHFRNDTVYQLTFAADRGIEIRERLVATEAIGLIATDRTGKWVAYSTAAQPRRVMVVRDNRESWLSGEIIAAGASLRQLAFSPDGRRLAALSTAGEIVLLTTEQDEEPIYRWTVPGGHYLVFYPTGERLALYTTGARHHVKLYDLSAPPATPGPPELGELSWSDAELDDAAPAAAAGGAGFGSLPYTVVPNRQSNPPATDRPRVISTDRWRGPYLSFDPSGRFLLVSGQNRLEVFPIDAAQPAEAKPAVADRQYRVDTYPLPGHDFFSDRYAVTYTDAGAVEIWRTDTLIEWVLTHRGDRTQLPADAHPVPITPPFADARVLVLDQLPLVLFYREGEECIKLYERNKGTFLGTLFPVNESKFLLIDEEGNYYTTAQGYDLVSFIYRGNVYPLDQFDLIFNRPQVLLRKAGFFVPELIEKFGRAYTKRLNRVLGEKTEQLLHERRRLEEVLGNRPLLQVRVINKYAIQGSTRQPDLSFVAYAKVPEGKDQLQRLVVYVNNVPISGPRVTLGRAEREDDSPAPAPPPPLDWFDFEPTKREMNGSLGLTLEEDYRRRVAARIELTLSRGLNKIDVAVIDSRGLEWLRDTFFVTYEPGSEEELPLPKLYIIGIGVSRHQPVIDSRGDKVANPLDLEHPARNVHRFIRGFLRKMADSPYKIGQILSYTTGDSTLDGASLAELGESRQELRHSATVTQDIVSEVKTFLQQHTTEEDGVLIFFCGHGITDSNNNLYLDTFAMDDREPERFGIRYEEMEGILDALPARRKLLLLDTCHSGEIDQAENLRFSEMLKSLEAFELMRDAFFDPRRGTGATVISSAGGTELAKENEIWEASAFTFCMLKALNEERSFTVSELQAFLAREVPRLLAPLDEVQNPTFRVRNISLDWRLW